MISWFWWHDIADFSLLFLFIVCFIVAYESLRALYLATSVEVWHEILRVGVPLGGGGLLWERSRTSKCFDTSPLIISAFLINFHERNSWAHGLVLLNFWRKCAKVAWFRKWINQDPTLETANLSYYFHLIFCLLILIFKRHFCLRMALCMLLYYVWYIVFAAGRP